MSSPWAVGTGSEPGTGQNLRAERPRNYLSLRSGRAQRRGARYGVPFHFERSDSSALIPPLKDGRLPLGRWPSDTDEVENVFANSPADPKRGEIWRGWLQLTAALRSVVRVPAAWLGGSFLTDKLGPNDLDCVYVVESSELASALSDPRRAPFVNVVAHSQVKSTFGLLVDSYILAWAPAAGVQPPVTAQDYLRLRGYWDDLWSRERSPDIRASSIPRRGYLEVILDGYR
jgi:hypothetical protein